MESVTFSTATFEDERAAGRSEICGARILRTSATLLSPSGPWRQECHHGTLKRAPRRPTQKRVVNCVGGLAPHVLHQNLQSQPECPPHWNVRNVRNEGLK